MAAKISKDYLPWYAQLREAVGHRDGGVADPMALIFDSTMGNRPIGQTVKLARSDDWAPKLPENITRPADDTGLCFMPVSAAVWRLCLHDWCPSGYAVYTAMHMEATLHSDNSGAKLPCKLLSLCCQPGMLKSDQGCCTTGCI